MSSSGAIVQAVSIASIVNTTIYFAGGCLYGKVIHQNQIIAGLAFATHQLACNCFRLFAETIISDENNNYKAYYTTLAVGQCLLGTIQILAFRKLKLIADVGTVGLCVYWYATLMVNLISLHKAFQDQNSN